MIAGTARLYLPILGTTKWPHLRENLGATKISFTPNELSEFRAALEALPIAGDRPDSAANERE